jgi:ADP-heptose:LPS heptosyltransferase
MTKLCLDSIRRILIVKLSSLGDVVHATPCLTALRSRFPRASLIWAVERGYADLLRHHPALDGLIEVEPMRGKLRQLRAIRQTLAGQARFDLAVDLQGTLRSAAWVYLSGARYRAGLGGPRPGWQVRLPAPTGKHAVEICAAVLEALDVTVGDLSPRLYCSVRAEAEVGQLLARRGLPSAGFVILNPFSRWRSKEWPPEHWAEVSRVLMAEYRQTVVITGAPDELIRTRGLLGLCPGVSLIGELTLGQAMCVYRRARLMITGDSGPMHVAAALGTPLLALFGPTLPERSGPWGQLLAVLQARRPTDHHVYRHDAGGSYIRALEVSTVLHALRQRLLEPRTRAS